MKENQNSMVYDLEDHKHETDQIPLNVKVVNSLWNAFEHKCTASDSHLATGEVFTGPLPVSSTAIASNNQLLVEKGSKLYTDKSVAECELSELIVCYKEPTYQVVKDICVDEGVPSHEKIMTQNIKDEHDGLHNFQAPRNDEISDLSNEKVALLFTVPDGVKKVDTQDYEGGADCCKEANIDENKSIVEDPSKEQIIPGKQIIMGKLGAHDIISESSESFFSQTRQRCVLVPDEATISHISASEELKDCCVVDELVSDNKTENGSIILHLDKRTPVVYSEGKSAESSDQEPDGEIIDMSKPDNRRSSNDETRVHCQLHPGPGEASFSATGPSSALLTHSGPIAYSGNLSLRSDSSTTSTRSFAFPVLQSEWNSSPVRMAKADRRRYRKQRSWRKGLLCCKF